MKAMILAAGRGERLRPLTDTMPKPLIPFGSGRLIDPMLRGLSGAGVREVVMNVCYLGEQIIDYLGDGGRYGLHIQYSREQEVLDTGGGIYRALPLLGEHPFLVVSADIVTDFPFETLCHRPLSGLAHLVFVDNPRFHLAGDFHLNADASLDLQGHNPLTYANIGVLHPQLFADCAPGKFPLAPLFREKISTRQITGEHYRGLWHNIGDSLELELVYNALAMTPPRK
jgi:N-acetyl-alpha-D-muramate 1-phosphate uridylyltransferase